MDRQVEQFMDNSFAKDVNTSFAKGLSVLDFFREGRISAHRDDIVEMLGTSKATAYRYLGTLCDAGLLAPTTGGVYVLGPKIIELERLMRIGDPFLLAGSRVMHEVSARHKLNMLLGSYYRDVIMCVDIAWPDPSIPIGFERGKPMSLFRGAMAKVVLAHLSPYQLRSMALHHGDKIRAAGLGDNWADFRAHMSRIAREGFAITHGEMMTGAGGIAAPIFDGDRKVIGSIAFVISENQWDSTDFDQLRVQIQEAAERVTSTIVQETDTASIEIPMARTSASSSPAKTAKARAGRARAKQTKPDQQAKR